MSNSFLVTLLVPVYVLIYFLGSLSNFVNSLAMSGHTKQCLSLMALAVSKDCAGGIPISRSLNKVWMKLVISRPAIGMCLIHEPMTYLKIIITNNKCFKILMNAD